MSNLILIILTIIISAAEPFLPIGTIAAAWIAVVGVKKFDSSLGGIFLAMIAGIVRDVVTVNRLGVSGLVLLFVWAAASLGVSKFGHPLAVVIASSFVASLIFDLISGGINPLAAGFSSLISLIIFLAWTNFSQRDNTIRLR